MRQNKRGLPALLPTRAQHREQLLEEVHALGHKALDNMIRLAEGVRAVRINRKGEEIIYDVPPNYMACAYLLNRVMGVEGIFNEAQLKEAQAQTQRVTGQLIALQAKAYAMNLIEPETVAMLLDRLQAAAIEYWQSIPAENMPRTQEQKDAHMQRFNRKISHEVGQALASMRKNERPFDVPLEEPQEEENGDAGE